jgi:hypothetical protein
LNEPITQERMERAMEYLAETDQAYADYKASLLRCEIMCKRVRARVFLQEEGTNEVRKMKAEVNAEVDEADKYLVEATLYLEGLKAKRSRAELLIDVFRTLEASRRKQ